MDTVDDCSFLHSQSLQLKLVLMFPLLFHPRHPPLQRVSESLLYLYSRLQPDRAIQENTIAVCHSQAMEGFCGGQRHWNELQLSTRNTKTLPKLMRRIHMRKYDLLFIIYCWAYGYIGKYFSCTQTKGNFVFFFIREILYFYHLGTHGNSD